MASIQPRFTREGYERLSSELESLKARRGELINDIKEAREQGDLRENHAYHQAKDAQGMVEARIAELEMRLAGAEVLQEGETVDEVILGIPVTVKMVGTDKTRTYNIVSPEELDEVDNGASQESPVGSALLGKKVGDIAEVQGPNGIIKFEVLSIGA
ncbi:MAG TPA: transcription elongation factor GreA [Abditibacteriaceae bacterium]